MSNAVQEAMRIAREKAAAATPPIETQAVATTQGQAQSNVMTYAPVEARPANLDTLMNAGMNVDEWLKVNGFGIQFGSKQGLVSEFIGRIRLQDIAVFYGIRFGDPATYLKSFDKVTCVQGGSWNEQVRKAQAVDQKAYEYVGADFTLVTEQDVMTPDGKTVLIEKGKRVGHSTSPTGGKTLAALVRDLKNTKQLQDDVWVKVKVKHAVRTKPNVAPWGVFDFEVLEVLGNELDED